MESLHIRKFVRDCDRKIDNEIYTAKSAYISGNYAIENVGYKNASMLKDDYVASLKVAKAAMEMMNARDEAISNIQKVFQSYDRELEKIKKQGKEEDDAKCLVNGLKSAYRKLNKLEIPGTCLTSVTKVEIPSTISFIHSRWSNFTLDKKRTLKDQIRTKNSEISRDEIEIDTNIKKIAEIQNEIDCYAAEYEKNKENVNIEITNRVLGMNNQVELLINEIEKINLNILKAKQKLIDKKDNKHLLEDTIEDYRSRIKNYESLIEKINKEKKIVINLKQQKYDEYEKELKRKKDKLQKHEDIIKNKTIAIDVNRKQLESLEKDLKEK